MSKQSRVTLKKINEKIAKHGVELVKGSGYFYFVGTDNRFNEIHLNSVYSTILSVMTVTQWVRYVEEQLKNV